MEEILKVIKRWSTNQILVLQTALITLLYVGYMISDIGLQRDISTGSSIYINNGQWYLPFIWLVSMFTTTTGISVNKWEKRSMILFLSGFILLAIIFFHGRFKGFDNHDMENILHVIFVNISIPLALIYMIWDSKVIKKLWLSLILIIPAIGFTVYCVFFNKFYGHTTAIELVFIGIILIYLYITNKKKEAEEEKQVEFKLKGGVKHPPPPPRP